MSKLPVKQILEAALMAAGRPLQITELIELFEEPTPTHKVVKKVLDELQRDYQGRGVEVLQVAGGYRMQVAADYAGWVSRLFDERPARYSRALLETLALVAYRQPISRGEIEEIRGVSVTSNIVRTLKERGWIRCIGHKDVPGKPELLATTRAFLDYFGLRDLSDLPPLKEIADLDQLALALDDEEQAVA